MLRNARALAFASLTTLALVACSDDGPSGPSASDASLTQAEAETVALQFDVTASTSVDSEITSQEATLSVQSPEFLASIPPGMGGDGTLEIQFTHTLSCELGGQVTTEGTMLRTWELETRHMTADVDALRTHEDCAFPVGELVMTVNGNPNVAITAHREREMGGPVGLQTMSHVGSVTWEKSDGTSGVCDIDFQATLDPETHTRTVEGEACGRTFRRTWTWRFMEGNGGTEGNGGATG